MVLMPTPPLFFLLFLPLELAEVLCPYGGEVRQNRPGPRGRVIHKFLCTRACWVATVGKHLEGHRPRHRATARSRRPAMVLAIFPAGTPYTIVTDALHTTGSNFQISSSERLWRSNILSATFCVRKSSPHQAIYLPAASIPFPVAFQRYRAASSPVAQSSMRTT